MDRYVGSGQKEVGVTLFYGKNTNIIMSDLQVLLVIKKSGQPSFSIFD